MSWLGDRLGIHVQVPGLRQAGGVVDKGVKGVADIQSNPWVQGLEAAALGATGVGAPAAAALLASSGALSGLAKTGGGTGAALSGALQGGVAGGAGALAGGALKGGLSLGGVGGAIKDAAGGLGGLVSKGVGALTGGGGVGLGGLVDSGLGIAQGINAANLQKKSTDYATGALDTANKSYDERAPLRSAGIAGMMDPTKGIDLSSLKKTAGRNSFAA